MAALDPDSGYYVLINTFTVEPADAERLLDELTRATRERFQSRPGFISANLHLSIDGRHVANYAQWRSRSDYEAASADNEVKAHMERAASVATSFDPIYYELREVIDAE